MGHLVNPQMDSYYAIPLRARITKSERSSYWYSGLIGEKFEVRRNQQGIKVVESEAKKIRELLGDQPHVEYYISEDDCRIVRI